MADGIVKLPLVKARGWRCGKSGKTRPIKNPDLWLRLDGLLATSNCTVELVRGHSGHPLNESCDAMVRAELKRYGAPLVNNERLKRTTYAHTSASTRAAV